MLTTTTILPSSFEYIEDDKSSYPFDLMLILLRDLDKNGILLVDKERTLKSQIDANISKWPKDIYKAKA